MKRRLEDWPDLQHLTSMDGVIYVHQSLPSGPDMHAVQQVETPPGEHTEDGCWPGSCPDAAPIPGGYALEFGTGRLMRLQYTPDCTQEVSWRRS